MKETNFIYEIFLDYRKDKQKYCLWRWCTTCGNRKIRDELFHKSINELGISFEETRMRKGFLYLRNIRQEELFTKILKLICQKLNNLTNNQVDTMLGPEPFYELDHNKDDFLKFLIMDIYSSLEGRFTDREKLINYLESTITNDKISNVIMKMNSRYLKYSNTRKQSVTME